MDFIIGVEPAGNEKLFEQVLQRQSHRTLVEWDSEVAADGSCHGYRFQQAQKSRRTKKTLWMQMRVMMTTLRGFCTSCGARRMVETAVLLVDHVLPHRPVHQWVLSFPYPLRSQPQAMGKVLAIVIRAISTFGSMPPRSKSSTRWSRRSASALPDTWNVGGAQPGIAGPR